jgi:hypothetical protein
MLLFSSLFPRAIGGPELIVDFHASDFVAKVQRGIAPCRKFSEFTVRKQGRNNDRRGSLAFLPACWIIPNYNIELQEFDIMERHVIVIFVQRKATSSQSTT